MEVLLALKSPRQPALQVFVEGAPTLGFLEVGVSNNNYMAADRFHLVASLDITGYEPWASDNIQISVQLGLDGAYQTLITGQADRIEVNVGARLVSIDGRDLTARFIEARTQETFENKTASEVVALLAARRGLAAQVTPTNALIGRSFDGDHSRTTLDQYSRVTTEWDLLARLADTEGFDVWVDDQTLYFAPPTAGLNMITIGPQSCTDLRLERVLPLEGSLQVIVKSWDSRAQETIVQSAGNVGQVGQARSYVMIRPNMSASEAASLASRTLLQMQQNTRVITLELPGETAIRARQSLSLVGTGTDFDGTYIVTSIDRHLSFRHGFTQILQARIPPWTVS